MPISYITTFLFWSLVQIPVCNKWGSMQCLSHLAIAIIDKEKLHFLGPSPIKNSLHYWFQNIFTFGLFQKRWFWKKNLIFSELRNEAKSRTSKHHHRYHRSETLGFSQQQMKHTNLFDNVGGVESNLNPIGGYFRFPKKRRGDRALPLESRWFIRVFWLWYPWVDGIFRENSQIIVILLNL